MTILYLDATAGIAGDMTVAALLDLGVPFAYLQDELERLGWGAGEYALAVSEVQRRGMRGCHFEVREAQHHHLHHHNHRSYADIRMMIDVSGLSAPVKELAQSIFLKLAEAEAQAHQVPVDQVRFHEVGAVDSIVDIVAVAICLDRLAVEQVYVSAVPLGGGFVETAHGRLPVPAPATLALLRGRAVHGRCGEGERVTPTGAAILAALAQPVQAMPDMQIVRVGHGAGSKDFEDCPNLLRAVLGESDQEPEGMAEVRCNLDDVTPEVIGYVQERLLEAGALDVWCTAIQMKKGRPAVMLSLLCAAGQAGFLADMIMRETGSLGVRMQTVQRLVAPRRVEQRQTPWGGVPCKVGPYGSKPEYEVCRQIARETGVPLREVQRSIVVGGGDE